MSGASDTKYLNSCLVFLLARTCRPKSGHWLRVPLYGSDRPLPAYSPPGRLARLDHGARDAQVLGWGGLVDLSVLFLLFLDVEGRWTAGLD